MKRCYNVFTLILLILLISLTLNAQVSIGSFGTAYTQNLNSLASSTSGNPYTWSNNITITGWYSNQTTYIVGPPDQASPKEGLYSLGTSSDRALGAIPSNTTGIIYYGIRMQNNTGAEIRSFTISYTGEQWRSRSGGGTQTVTFGYQVAASFSDITTGSYSPVGALTFTSPVTNSNNNILDGNASANQQSFSNVVINVVVPIGEEIMFRWADAASGNNTNQEYGLGIDDLFITAWPQDNGLPVELSSFSAIAGDEAVTLNWVTESEVNNMQFDVLRAYSRDADYVLIGTREGQYNTNQRTEYTFTDNAVANGTTYWYKLVDIDLNGVRTEHGPISATPGLPDAAIPNQFKLYQNFPNPFNPQTTLEVFISGDQNQNANIVVEVFNVLGQKVKTVYSGNLQSGAHQFTWNGDNETGAALPGGIYYAVLTAGSIRNTVKMVLLK